MTTVTPNATHESRGSAIGSWLKSRALSREMGIVLAVVILIVVTTAINPAFLFSPDGWRDLFLAPAILAMLAAGQAAVIISRNIDLSSGSMLGLCAYFTGRIFVDFPGLNVIVVLLAVIVFGGLLGLINGLLTAVARVPALVITLGTLYAYRGFLVLWAGSDRINAGDMPKDFLAFGSGMFVGVVPWLAVVAIIVLIVLGWCMANLRSGRSLYAIGSNPAAAQLYGIRTTPTIVGVFVLSGVLASVAGFLFAARYGTVSSQAGLNYELLAVGAAVVGGVAIFGGSGTVWGAAFGALLLVTINRALPVIGIDDFWQRAVVGVLILGAILLDRILAVQQQRRLARGKDNR